MKRAVHVVRGGRAGRSARWLLWKGSLAAGSLAVAVLSGLIIVSALWSVQRRWHGISLERGTYHSGEIQLDHGVFRWELRGERPTSGFFDDLVYWSSFESGYGLLEGWDVLPVLQADDDGYTAKGEVRLLLPWIIAAAVTGLLWARAWRRRCLRRAGGCSECGYDRRGLAEGVACPECGAGTAQRSGAAEVARPVESAS